MKKIILACLLIPFMFSSAYAEESIGTVNKVKTYAHGTRVYQERKPLFARDEVYRNEMIETVKSGAIWITFNDGSDLYMNESGKLVLNAFIYSDGGDDDFAVISMVKGLFRFVTGKISSEKVTITSPVATMGIRGTDIEITIDETGMTTATAFEGIVTVTSAHFNAETEGCQTIKISRNGLLLSVGPCPPGGPSIGPATFAVGSFGGGGYNGQSNPGNDSGSPSGGDSGGPGDGPSNDGPSGGPGNGNGNNGNPGNGGGNTNGSGPGTGNNGQNNGQGNGGRK